MTLWLLLLFPIAWPFIAKRIWQHEFSWKELALNIVIVSILTTGVFQLGKYGQTIDTEVWNGQITAKKRHHDKYVESYECNCTTYSCGTSKSPQTCETCSTCYRDHFTVEWYANSTVGKIRFDYFDRTSRSVYLSPDPSSFKRCKVGQPAALEKTYTNYVQAVPQSLFHDDSTQADQFVGKIPAYPRVYDFYRINRVINVDSKVSAANVKKINDDLNIALKTLGATKQANIVVVLTEIDDPSYRYAIENAWLGGEKNDIVIMVGLDDDNITWVDIMTWALNSGNELFHVTLRDGILKTKTLDPATFTPLVVQTIGKLYDRPHMKEYEYLADEIDPPTWVFIVAWIISIFGSIGLTLIFRRTDI